MPLHHAQRAVGPFAECYQVTGAIAQDLIRESLRAAMLVALDDGKHQ